MPELNCEADRPAKGWGANAHLLYATSCLGQGRSPALMGLLETWILLSAVPEVLTAGLSSVPATPGVTSSDVSMTIPLSLAPAAPTGGWRCVRAGLDAACSTEVLTRCAPFVLQGKLEGSAASDITG